jgi:Phosphotransferase enzyme family
MFTPPEGLPDAAVAAELADGWDLSAVSVAYRAVGFGSHHWAVTDVAGGRWFVSGDDLPARREDAGEPLAAVFGRLRGSLATARELRDQGLAFVVAPVPASDGEVLRRVGDQFSLALYPEVAGRSFAWGEFPDPAHRRAVLRMIIAVHAAPPAARRAARPDDFAVTRRGELEAALRGDDPGDCGPYARPAARLLAGHAAAVGRFLARYDDLARQGRAAPGRMVLTHGEPHPGNTMLAADGWRLIDWDTVLVAPPERDLWSLDPGDGSLLAEYAAAAGRPALPEMLELYRIRWSLSDMALAASRFRAPHAGSADDDQDWENLQDYAAGLAEAGGPGEWASQGGLGG